MKKYAFILICILIIPLSGCSANTSENTTETSSPSPSASAVPILETSPLLTIEQPSPTPEVMPEPTQYSTPEQIVEPTPQSSSEPIDFNNPDWLELGEGSKMLTEEEINWFNTEFFNGDMMNIHNQFLSSTYDKPENINLYELLYNGTGPRTEEEMARITAEDISSYIAKYGHWATEVPTIKLPVKKINEVLLKNTGLLLDETNKIGLRYRYISESDAYFHNHSDTNYMFLTMLYGYRDGNTIFLFYSGSMLIWNTEKQDYDFISGVFRAELYDNGDSYLFKSNMRVETSNNEIKYEAYMDAPEVKEDKAETEKIKIESDTAFGSDSFEKALENIEAQSGVRIFFEEVYTEYWPLYGDLVCFELTGTPHGVTTQLYFVYYDGRVCQLPLPVANLIGTPVTHGYENNMFYLMGGRDEFLCYVAIFAEELMNNDNGNVIHKAGYYYYYFIPATMECYLTIVE